MAEWGAFKNLIWFWAVPATAGLFLIASMRKKSEMARFGDPQLIEKLTLSLDRRKRLLKRALWVTAVALMVVALGQPHLRKKETLVERKGIDVIIALDVSRSMLAKDIPPNRLEKAKLELAALIDKLKGDRIGIVAFAGEAVIQCPLTTDKGAVKLFLSTANPNLIPYQGTAIGKAVLVSLEAFADKEKEHKAIVLLTDGEDHEGNPLEAARRAKERGVRIFTIGFGTPDGSTLQEGSGSYKKDRAGQVVLSRLNEGLLKEMASGTGGVYYRASRGELELDGLIRHLRQMGQKGFTSDWMVEYEENYQPFLLAAFLLLLIEMALSEAKGQGARRFGRSAAALLFCFFFLSGFQFYGDVKNEQGNRLYEKGKIEKAKTAYLEGLKSKPDSPEIAYNLGNTYYKEGAYAESLKSYKKAAGNGQNAGWLSKAFYNLGNSLVRAKQDDKAKEFYKQALRLDPNDQDAKYNLELLMKKEKEPQKKDQQKQDQEKQQNQQDQKDQQQNQQGQGGESDPQKEKSGDDKSEGGENKEDKEGQDAADKSEGGESSQGKSEEEQSQQEEKERQEKERQEQQQAAAEQQRAEEQRRQQEEKRQDQQGSGEEDAESPKPKSQAEARAEQILEALENQEKQALRFESGTNNPRNQIRRVAEKDW